MCNSSSSVRPSSFVLLSASANAMPRLLSTGSSIAAMCVQPNRLAACSWWLPARTVLVPSPLGRTTIGFTCPNSSYDAVIASTLPLRGLPSNGRSVSTGVANDVIDSWMLCMSVIVPSGAFGLWLCLYSHVRIECA